MKDRHTDTQKAGIRVCVCGVFAPVEQNQQPSMPYLSCTAQEEALGLLITYSEFQVDVSVGHQSQGAAA